MSTDKKTTISLTPNGPYIIKNLTKFTSQKGLVKPEQTMALCRCGASANKPFCDGSHVKMNFTTDNTETHLKNKRDDYVGKDITVYDNRSICAHAGVCTDNLARVFRMKQEPWIDPNAADVNEIIAVIMQCPSGALSYSLNEGDNIQQENKPGVFIAPNGPYVVSGCPDLSGTNWREGASQQKYTLCRCGASKNKPYCDGSHWSIEFTDNEN
jgi:CDGSH-type Zn-finger protein